MATLSVDFAKDLPPSIALSHICNLLLNFHHELHRYKKPNKELFEAFSWTWMKRNGKRRLEREKKLRRGNEIVAKISSFFQPCMFVAVSTEHEMPNLLFYTQKSLNITARPLGLVIIMSKSKPQWTAQYFLQSGAKSWTQKIDIQVLIHILSKQRRNQGRTETFYA